MPDKHAYEFFGPPGAFFISFGLPIVCYAFALLCNDISGCPTYSILHPSSLTLDKLKQEIDWQGWSTIFTWEAFFANLSWYLISLVLYAVLPATEVEGTTLSGGGRLKYRLNAFNSAVFTLSILAAGTLAQGADFVVWTYIWNNYTRLLTSNIIVAYLLSTYLYLASFTVQLGGKDNRELAAGGNTGHILYDWFIGRELNPRITIPLIGEVDLKCWMEIRPGLLGWLVLDYAFVAAQYRHYGYVTDSILLVTVAQSVYVFDSLYLEPAILTTIDIIHDGYGNMLVLGVLVWIPFTFSLQARYLAVHPISLGYYNLLVLGTLALGYYIFRSSNNEKNRFRTNPNDPKIKHLKYMETKAGSKLLITGWWGQARHINYLGDWVLSWAYCLPTGIAGYQIYQGASASAFVAAAGFDQGQGMPPGAHVMFKSSEGTIVAPGDAKGWGMIVTYFYLLYFAVLLIHRERRDEEKCKNKYGEDWDKYTEKVPSRIVPYVY